MIGKGKFQGQKTIMKQKLCFRITTKLGNLKGQPCLWQERRPLFRKPAKKEKKEKNCF